MTHRPPALVLGVDTPIGLTIVRELGCHGVTVHSIGARDAIGAASRHVASHTPRPSGPIGVWLPAIIRSTGTRALFAISEHDLVALAALPSEIEGCRVLSPRIGPLRHVLDKSRTLETARDLGMATPLSWQPEPGAAAAAWTALGGGYPAIAKWADPPAIAPLLASAGLPLLKAERIDEPAQLSAMFDRYRSIAHLPLVQQFCDGHGVGHMLLMDRGRAVLRFAHRRLHEWPPSGGVSTWCRAIPIDGEAGQIEQSEALLRAVGWEGPAMVEYRHDPATGRYWLMEINGRFWGSLPLAFHAGHHFAWAQYCAAFPEAGATAQPPFRAAQARFMIPETRRLLHRLRHGGGEGRVAALARYLGGFVAPAMHYYVWDRADPGPFFRDMTNSVRRAARRDSARSTG